MICNYCVMDSSDPDIEFDDDGVCNHCKDAKLLIERRTFSDDVGIKALDKIIQKVKLNTLNSEYDGIIGLSGGVDSSYLLHVLVGIYKLRILAVHVNAGWNSEIAESNIELLVKSLGVDLYTYVVDWEEMRELQLAYLRSGLVNQDVPQDHVFFTILYEVAYSKRIRYVFTGHNVTSESIMPKSWGYNSADSLQLKWINRKFGTKSLVSYKTISLVRRLYYSTLYKQEIIKPLDFLNYNKNIAIEYLQDNYKWKVYRYKHGESIWTSFYQNYWLIERNGIDKRKAHLSSLIVSGQVSRTYALALLNSPAINELELKRLFKYVSLKLKVTSEELNHFMTQPVVNYNAYPNSSYWYNLFFKILGLIKFKKGKF
jgi:N-acetyl sugar amidotransferase